MTPPIRARPLGLRERQVVDAFLDGHEHHAIADRLGITARTVHTHLRVARCKANAWNSKALAHALFCSGLYDPAPLPPDRPRPDLGSRERQVLHLLAQGYPLREMARRLTIPYAQLLRLSLALHQTFDSRTIPQLVRRGWNLRVLDHSVPAPPPHPANGPPTAAPGAGTRDRALPGLPSLLGTARSGPGPAHPSTPEQARNHCHDRGRDRR